MSKHGTARFLVSAASLCLSHLALAANIHFNPASISGLSIGQEFTLEIVGSEFVDNAEVAGSAGGGINLQWDASVFDLVDLSKIVLSFPSDRSFRSDGSNGDGKGELDRSGGRLRNLSVASLDPVADSSFSIAKLTFKSLRAGSSDFALTLGKFAGGEFNSWTTFGGAEVIPNLSFSSATVSVAAPVPLPAAAWLLSSALPLVGFRRSRKGSCAHTV